MICRSPGGGTFERSSIYAKSGILQQKISAELGALISNYGAFFGGEADLMTLAMDVLIMQPDGYVRRSYQSDDPAQNREFVITKPEKVAKVTSVLSSLLEKVRTALKHDDPKEG